jgi:hypothetical protein
MSVSFDISSPKSGPVFAYPDAQRRRVYGTRFRRANFTKPALLLGIMRSRFLACLARGVKRSKSGHSSGSEDRDDFRADVTMRAPNSHENEAASLIGRGTLSRLRGLKIMRIVSIPLGSAGAGAPVDIRVTPNEII